jgi:D-serine deaminase-like pyridoxal phosphate-dependent protein
VKGDHVLHNEEHLVVETPEADRFEPGDVAYALPAHICPTCALHQFAHVVENGQVVDRWEIASRDRMLTI